MKYTHHPIQPLYKDTQGVIRFKENKIELIGQDGAS